MRNVVEPPIFLPDWFDALKKERLKGST